MSDYKTYLSLYDGKHGWDRNPNDFTSADDGAHIEDSNDQWEWGISIFPSQMAIRQ